MGKPSLDTKIEQIDTQLADKATKAELNALGQLKLDGQYDTLSALQTAKPTGATGLYLVIADGWTYRWNGSAWTQASQFQSSGIGDGTVTTTKYADGSMTPVKVHDDTYQETNLRRENQDNLEYQHGQILNLFTGIKDGTFATSGQTISNFTQSFVVKDTIPYVNPVVTKFMRLAFNNTGGSEISALWGKKLDIPALTTTMTNGFWVRKSDIQGLGSARLSPLVSFYNSSGTLLFNLTTVISSTPTNVATVGYTITKTTNGVTLTFKVEKEYNGWLYCTQKIDSIPSDAVKADFQFWLQTILAGVSGKVDLFNYTVITNSTTILPFFVYPEAYAEKAKKISDFKYQTVNFGYNLEATLRKYRASLSKRTSQIVKIAVIGDSISEGLYSGLNYDRAYPVQLRKLMQAKYGGQDEGLVTAKDTDRWTATGTWTNAKKGIALWQKSSANNGDKLTFTFTGVAVDIIYSKNTDGGNCAVKIDGVDKTALSCYNATEIYSQSQSYTGLSAEAHTLEIFAPTNATKAYIEGAYVKTVGDTCGIRVDRRACAGTASSEWHSTLQLDTFSTQPADLFILALGVNDCGALHTPTAMKADLQAIITKLKTVGSVIIIPVMQASATDTTRATWTTDYVPKFYELADENNIGLIDVNKLYGDYTTAQSYGLFGITNGDGEGTDTLHPSQRGHQMIADTIFKLIA